MGQTFECFMQQRGSFQTPVFGECYTYILYISLSVILIGEIS